MKKDQYTVWKTKYTHGGGGRDKDNLKLLFKKKDRSGMKSL